MNQEILLHGFKIKPKCGAMSSSNVAVWSLVPEATYSSFSSTFIKLEVRIDSYKVYVLSSTLS